MVIKSLPRVSIAKRAAAIKKKTSVAIPIVKKPVAKPKKVMVKFVPKPVVKKFIPEITTIQNASIEKKLIDNFISTQKVLVNLSVKFDNLANQISKLVELFEISAKSLAKKDFDIGGGKGIKDRLDNIIEQNKLIARGLTLMHGRGTGQKMPMPRPLSPERPMMQKHIESPPPTIQPSKLQEPSPPIPDDMQGYERSLSSGSPQQFKKLKENP